MLLEAISGLNLEIFDTIHFVFHEEYEEKYGFLNGFLDELPEEISNKVVPLFLDKYTKSQPETVYEAIKFHKVPGWEFLFVKDADNYFQGNVELDKNQIFCYDLKNFDGADLKNKCYLERTTDNVITNIVEKNIISSTFAIGGYGFQTADLFCKHYEQIVKSSNWPMYMSNVYFEMLLGGHSISAIEGIRYKDWGTDKAWNEYVRQYKVIFLDIDGVLVENSSAHFPPGIGNTPVLQNNIQYIKKLIASGKVHIIYTTSRPHTSRKQTVDQLEKVGIYANHLIMDLPHCQRIVVNDFAPSNPYPSCTAINLPRDADNLEEYLK
jgi:hypothetical protein